MNMLPYDYYCMTHYEYNLKCDGYAKARELDQYMLRRVAYIVHASLVEKPVNPDTLWPIGEKKPDEISPELLKKLAAVRQKDKLKLLNDGRTTDSGGGGYLPGDQSV